MAGGDLRAVLLSITKPRVNGFFACQVIKRLTAKPIPPIPVTFAAIAGNAGTAQIFWHGQAAEHFWNNVVKRGAAEAELLVAVCATVITAEQHSITPSPLRLLPRDQRRSIDLMIHCWHLAGETFRFQATADHPRSQ